MKLKRIPVIILKIIIIIAFVITLNRIFLPKYINENQDGRITGEYYLQDDLTDVIFVGSSTVYSGISPVTLWQNHGISSYNRSNASQTMWISYAMIEEAINRNKPELVCLDIGFSKYEDDYVEEPSTRKSLDGMHLSSTKINCIKESMGEDEKLIEYLIPLFRYHSRWKELSLDDFKYAYYYKPVTSAGMIINDDVEATTVSSLEYSRDENASLSPRNVDYLNRIIDLCAKNNVSLLLFKTPSFDGNWSVGYDAQIGAIAKDNGINYVNFEPMYEEIGLDYSVHTYDGGSHLNRKGAECFSKFLGDYLVDNYTITDRRNTQKYDDFWNNKLESYLNK